MHPIKADLDKISSCFCAAKWLQVTLHLENGNTHSCHHTKLHTGDTLHKIPFKELENSPSALHNTKAKKKSRQMMLEGKRPPECSYCWKVEDLSGDLISDRYYKSDDDWSKPYLESLSKMPWDANVVPKYLEVSFSNICNFKCAYCGPDVSSRWMSEVVEHGPYPTSEQTGSLVYLKAEGIMPISDSKNPYLMAFWNWLPEIISELHVLRVTGGEPLLSKDWLKLMQFLDTHPNSNLDLSINTNLGVPTHIVATALDHLLALKAQKKIKSAHIFTSLDTWGDQATFIRFGLDLELWKSNLELCLTQTETAETIVMVTFNALSVFRFRELLQYTLEQKEKSQGHFQLDISILHNPKFLNVQTLDSRHHLEMLKCLQFMKLNHADKIPFGFYDHEIAKMERLCEFVQSPLCLSRNRSRLEELNQRRIDFVGFMLEHDRRRKTDFVSTFPEMKEDFVEWKKLYDEQNYSHVLTQKVLRLSQKWIGPYLC
jgi:organic radical activating enzyme